MNTDYATAMNAMNAGGIAAAGETFLKLYQAVQSRKTLSPPIEGNIEDLMPVVARLVVTAGEGIPLDSRINAALDVVSKAFEEIRAQSRQHSGGSPFRTIPASNHPNMARALLVLGGNDV